MCVIQFEGMGGGRRGRESGGKGKGRGGREEERERVRKWSLEKIL